MRPGWVDRVNRAQPAQALAPPPRSGHGSSRAAWAEYAIALGYRVDATMGRAAIIELTSSGPPPGPNRAALEEQLAAMATGPEHRALMQAARTLADRVDQVTASGSFSDKVWREYRLALRYLGEAVTDGDPDPLEEFYSRRGALRDTEDAGT